MPVIVLLREIPRMRSEPLSYKARSTTDEPIEKGAAIGRRIGAQLLHEAHEALPPTLFFFVGFNFIVLTTNLLAAQYLIAVSNFMLATMAALVVGKAVLVANKIPLLRRYYRAPLIQPIYSRQRFTGSSCFSRACSSASNISCWKAIRRAILDRI
jgi:hypothetical protein